MGNDESALRCGRCGGELDAAYAFCPVCGAVQETEAGKVRQIYRNQGLWRKGELLVASKDATFPARCLKTNRETSNYVSKSFSWYNPAFALMFPLVCVCAPVGLIAAIISYFLPTQKVVFNLPFIPEVISEHRRAILQWMSICVGVLVFAPLAHFFESVLILVAGGAAMAVCAVLAHMFVPILRVTKVDKDYVFIKDVHPQFLDDLPYFPG